jgi:translation initiation factor 5
MAININHQIDDTFYRYQMSELETRQEGKGNGKSTRITNLLDISKSLSIPQEFIIKYISLQLGTKSTNNVINGHHTKVDLMKLLYNFIDVFILCKTCSIPELSYYLDKKIYMDCSACGTINELESDNKLNQKLITTFKNYILQNGKILNTNVCIKNMSDPSELRYNAYDPFK